MPKSETEPRKVDTGQQPNLRKKKKLSVLTPKQTYILKNKHVKGLQGIITTSSEHLDSITMHTHNNTHLPINHTNNTFYFCILVATLWPPNLKKFTKSISLSS